MANRTFHAAGLVSEEEAENQQEPLVAINNAQPNVLMFAVAVFQARPNFDVLICVGGVFQR
jgi:hypothetical protein